MEKVFVLLNYHLIEYWRLQFKFLNLYDNIILNELSDKDDQGRWQSIVPNVQPGGRQFSYSFKRYNTQ